MSDKRHQIGALAAQIIQASMVSGLLWDESVAAFGIAAKVMAEEAAKNGDGEDCLAHARKRFDEGCAQPVQVVFGASDPAAFKRLPQEAADAVLANASIKVFMKKPH
jgi:hypothetical protein